MHISDFQLSGEALSLRRSSIGGSDANILMSGDPERIYNLWADKTGQVRERPDPTLNMLMGHATEQLNQAWYTHQTGDSVTDTQMISRMLLPYPAHATLDGMCLNGEAVWEAKHTSGYDFQTKARKTVEDMVADYYPQLHHNMRVCGVERAVLSVFFDNNRWETATIQMDAFYADALIDAEIAFWACVTTGKAPEGFEPKLDVKVRTIQATREVDFTGDNQWASFAAQYLATKAAAKDHDAAAAGLKKLIEDDVGRASGYGITAKRDKRGAIRISEGS
jgi:predicted phage-related endonuclease